MTDKEKRERVRLHHKWAVGRASLREMSRCMVLDRKYAAARLRKVGLLMVTE